MSQACLVGNASVDSEKSVKFVPVLKEKGNYEVMLISPERKTAGKLSSVTQMDNSKRE